MNPAPLLVLLALVIIGALVAAYMGRRRSRKLVALRLQAFSVRRAPGVEHLLRRHSGPGASAFERLLSALPVIATIERQIERWLERAGTQQTLPRFVLLAAEAAVVAGILAGLLSGRVLIGLLAGLLAVAAMLVWLRVKGDQRRTAFEIQLPEALDFIGRALRAGHGLTMAIGMVGEELPAPIGPEFRIVFDQINFGISFDDAISNLSRRIDSTDLNFFVIATKIHKETGGNFVEILESISKTVRDRIILQGKVRVLSAEGKFSGILLGLLPFLIGGIMTLVNPKYMSELWYSEKGQSLVAIGMALIALGFAWMWHIARIRV